MADKKDVVFGIIGVIAIGALVYLAYSIEQRNEAAFSSADAEAESAAASEANADAYSSAGYSASSAASISVPTLTTETPDSSSVTSQSSTSSDMTQISNLLSQINAAGISTSGSDSNSILSLLIPTTSSASNSINSTDPYTSTQTNVTSVVGSTYEGNPIIATGGGGNPTPVTVPSSEIGIKTSWSAVPLGALTN